MKAFRGRVHRGGKPGGPRADDHHIDELVVQPDVQHAKTAAERLFRGIHEHRAVGTHHDDPVRCRTVLLGHHVRRLVASGMHDVVRVAVALEERLQAQHVRRLRVADDHGSTHAGFDERDAAQDQRAHDALAQIGFGDDQRAQLIRRNQKRLDLIVRLSVHHRLPPGKLRNLGEKLAATSAGERHDMTKPVAQARAHGALQHDEHPRARLAGGQQTLACCVATHRAEAADARDFGFRELREQLLAAAGERGRKLSQVLARREIGGGRIGHGRYYASLMNASSSSFTLSLRVVHMPCGAPLYTTSFAFFTIFAESSAESSIGTI